MLEKIQVYGMNLQVAYKHIIKLRTLRTPNSGNLKLQICDSISWNGSANVVFKLRRMI